MAWETRDERGIVRRSHNTAARRVVASRFANDFDGFSALAILELQGEIDSVLKEAGEVYADVYAAFCAAVGASPPSTRGRPISPTGSNMFTLEIAESRWRAVNAAAARGGQYGRGQLFRVACNGEVVRGSEGLRAALMMVSEWSELEWTRAA